MLIERKKGRQIRREIPWLYLKFNHMLFHSFRWTGREKSVNINRLFEGKVHLKSTVSFSLIYSNDQKWWKVKKKISYSNTSQPKKTLSLKSEFKLNKKQCSTLQMSKILWCTRPMFVIIYCFWTFFKQHLANFRFSYFSPQIHLNNVCYRCGRYQICN